MAQNSEGMVQYSIALRYIEGELIAKAQFGLDCYGEEKEGMEKEMFKCMVGCEQRMDLICCSECDIQGCNMRCDSAAMKNCKLLQEVEDESIHKAKIQDNDTDNSFIGISDNTNSYSINTATTDK